jgi:hypothetical protein
MKKPLLVLALLAFSLPIGCNVEEDAPPDPLAKAAGFCDAWAKNACQTKVLEACNTPDVADCESSQSAFCLEIVPENYQSSKYASECLNAVKAAYKDADLTAAEIAVVIKLGAPCDKLSKGSSSDGEACEKNDDCNTAGGFSCIIKLGEAAGTCGKPEEVGPAEACDGPTQVCGEGNYCNGENCVVYKKTGGPCAGDYQCKPEDHCVIDDTVDPPTGACEVRAELSADCESDDDCQSRFCMVASGETVGKCASTIRLSISEPLCDNLR